VEDHYKVEFIEALNLFKIKLFADIPQSSVELCFKTYEKRIKGQGLAPGFKLLINVSSGWALNQAAHRHLKGIFSRHASHKNCLKMAVVNEGSRLATHSEGNTMERFFINEPEALVWLWS